MCIYVYIHVLKLKVTQAHSMVGKGMGGINQLLYLYKVLYLGK